MTGMEPLRAHLLKSFTNVECHISRWNEINKEAEPTLKILSGLSEQLDCVMKTGSCPLTDNFPHLKGRLEHIIRAQMEEEIAALRLYLDELNQLNNKLKSSWDLTQASYLDSYQGIQADPAFYQGTPLHPPVCSMIEWLDDINNFYTMKFLELKFAIDGFNYSPEGTTRISSHWNTKRTSPTIESIVAKMHLFIREK